MEDVLKVGILGTGSMAVVMAAAMQKMKHVKAEAVASRTPSKAQAFAERFGIPKAYGSYDEMIADGDLDLIYVVSPHSHHAVYAAQCIDAGVPVLVEKSFTANAREAEELIRRAEEKGVFLAEAIWTRYMPLTQTIRRVIRDGKIGAVTAVTANLGYAVSHRERVAEPALAGGALLDVGIYPLTFLSTVLGEDFSQFQTAAVLSDKGVDLCEHVSFLASCEGRQIPCSFYASSLGPTDRNGIVYGTEGYIIVGNVNHYEYIEIYDGSHRLKEVIDAPEEPGTGYEFQFEACRRALAEGKQECDEMPHEKILAMMRLMDTIRAKMGVVYPNDRAE